MTKTEKPALALSSDEQIRQALERVFRDVREDSGSPDPDLHTRDFVFHMVDWREDLLALADLYRDPQGRSSAEWDRAVNGFLINATGHLLAAARLTGYVPVQFDAATPSSEGSTKRAKARIRS